MLAVIFDKILYAQQVPEFWLNCKNGMHSKTSKFHASQRPQAALHSPCHLPPFHESHVETALAMPISRSSGFHWRGRKAIFILCMAPGSHAM